MGMENFKPTRDVWLWLMQSGGRYTAHEVAEHFGWDSDYAVERLFTMARDNLIEKFPPEPGQRRKRYGVTGLCNVPQGLRVAEVQV